MKIGVCPVTGAKMPESTSNCPIAKLLDWCKWRVCHAVSSLPFRQKNTEFDTLIRHASTFANLLIKYKGEAEREAIRRIGLYEETMKIKNQKDAIEKIFIQYGTKTNGVFCEDFLIIFTHIVLEHLEEFHEACDDDQANYMRIFNAYQIGFKIAYDIWRDVMRAYEVRYKRLPTPAELSQFTPFIVDFTHGIAQLPSLHAVPIREEMIKVQAKPHLFIDASGSLQFVENDFRRTTERSHRGISQMGNASIKNAATNRYCPALPMIPKIAQMCCDVFQVAYEQACTREYK